MDIPVSSHPTIFIVDDNAGIRSALVLLIESVGWEAREFDSAEAFLDAYTPVPEQCLIVDLNLPGMNGVELLAQPAVRESDIPTIIITARPDSPVATTAKEAGAVAVLTKPFKSTELLPIVERAIAAHQTVR